MSYNQRQRGTDRVPSSPLIRCLIRVQAADIYGSSGHRCLNGCSIIYDYHCKLIIKATNLRGLKECGNDFGLYVGFGVWLAGEEQRVVVDDARKHLETFVHRQAHSCSSHFTDDLSRKRYIISPAAYEPSLPDK